MIIGICGGIGSGKDTIAQYICDSRGFVRVSMAAALKDAAAAIFGWNRDMLEGLTQEHRALREQVDTFWADRLSRPDFSPRVALQILGTDLFRDSFHTETWVIAAERKLMQCSNAVISDIRFPNEIEMIKRYNGQLWHVRRGDDPVWWQSAKDHIAGRPGWRGGRYYAGSPSMGRETDLALVGVHYSEWAWANTKFDVVLDNNDTLAALYNEVELILQSSNTK